MNGMYAVERRQWLIERARTSGRLDVTEVSDELGLARETIRRDLTSLERQGLLRRVYGGAVPVERLTFESNLTMRAQRRQEEKHRIAVVAANQVRSAESIYIDEGNLPQLVAEQLKPTRPITVVTPSLAIAKSLVEKDNIEVLCLGGRVRAQTLGVVDHWAVSMLESLVLDLAFMGANGVTLEHGMTVPDSAVAAVKIAAIRCTRRRIFVGDSTKFGSNSFVKFADIADFERIVTDNALPIDYAAELHSRGVELTRA
jgi:DeoR family fructose operon transcriptional repressor